MMTTNIGPQIEVDVQQAYGSFSTPNWSFAEMRYNSHPYAGLIDLLTEFGEVQETTDLNDDVSVVVFTDLNGSNGVTLRLSLVGKYACVSDLEGWFLTKPQLMEDSHTQRVLDLIHEQHIVLLEPNGLTNTIGFGDGHATIYEVLFSSDEAIG